MRFEGLSASADGNTLYVLLQSAAIQDGGNSKATRQHVRFLTYDVSDKLSPVLTQENVVPLPSFIDGTDGNKTRFAAQSELYSLQNGQFLMLARDSSAGTGLAFSQSNYRHIDVFDVSAATDIAGTKYDDVGGAVSPGGVLVSDITPATVCPWIDFNVNSELAKFGLHNGGAQDIGLLNEKWESISLVPIHVDEKGNRKSGAKADSEYYIISLSDNDFITQDGAMNFGNMPYSDESGAELNNQALVFKVRIES
ncbi:unnamed protein product [Parascedosporium putredinis]|uniref:Phytase-like domain-containing protein n=1 Tax=Parascedosporium putredinis TaxID=1442378 RepID=A0A9P1H0V4_9PEZI|nr:unnamed protein product [Parascedosporium putredinis]CAI7992462.1 unnamed protein product [Parascedosporium putredinis]